jgi:hypothetical protein
MNAKQSLRLGKRVATRSARLQLRARVDFRSKAQPERVAALAARAFASIRRGHEANIDVGRTFNEIKSVLGHGRWKAYFRKTFAPCGITQRTAQNYMGLARQTDADLKKENFSFSQVASDPHAQGMRRANAKAKTEVAMAMASRPRQNENLIGVIAFTNCRFSRRSASRTRRRNYANRPIGLLQKGKSWCCSTLSVSSASENENTHD